MVPVWTVLGAFSTLDSGGGPYLGLGIGGLIGVFFGLGFGGKRGGECSMLALASDSNIVAMFQEAISCPLFTEILEMPKTIPQTIRIDPEVWLALQKRAEPFVETPNDVLRRLLGLGESPRTTEVHSTVMEEKKESPMDIPDALKQAAIELQRELGDVYISRSKLIHRALEIMSECGKEVREDSIIPSDYCYNRENEGSRKRKFFLGKTEDFTVMSGKDTTTPGKSFVSQGIAEPLVTHVFPGTVLVPGYFV